MTVHFQILGVAALKKATQRRKKNLDNRRRFYQRAVVYVDKWIQDNFKTEGKPFGGWKPLAPSTIARRRKGKKVLTRAPTGGRTLARDRILQDTGQLKSRWKKSRSARYGVIQSGVPYAIFHDEGKGNVPKREIIPDKEMVNPALKKLLAIFVRESLKLR